MVGIRSPSYLVGEGPIFDPCRWRRSDWADCEAGYTQLLPSDQYGPVLRIAVALYGLAFYVRKTILPLGLSPHYPLPVSFDPWAWDWPFLLSGLDLGGALFAHGEVEEAIHHFRQALRSDPAYAKAHHNLGIALARRGDLEGAIAHFRQAVLIEPGSAEAHESLGRALAQQGRRDEAMKHYQEALRIMKSRRTGRAPS